jgi:hypothetical protein
MKTRKPKLGGRYIAYVRGAFHSLPARPPKQASQPEAVPRSNPGSFPGTTAARCPIAQFR